MRFAEQRQMSPDWCQMFPARSDDGPNADKLEVEALQMEVRACD
jgi:hypothetical protein